MKKNVPEGIHIKKVSWSGVGHCEAKTTKPAEVPPKAENLPPFPRNQVDYFNATVGQLLVFQVPEVYCSLCDIIGKTVVQVGAELFRGDEKNYINNQTLDQLVNLTVKLIPRSW